MSSYANIFNNAAKEEGAQIIVNYTAETEELVDQMIASKTDGSNVIKGICK